MANEVPAFDDIPSFDDLPDAASTQAPPQQSAGQVPRFDDIPSFDDIPDENSGHPAAEGPVVSALREAAHAVIPAAVGTVAAGAGAAGGSLVAPVAGTLAGGAAGFVGGSMAADYVQEKALKAFGFDDSAQRAANAEANPKSSFVGGLAPALATMNPVAAGEKIGQRIAQRATGAAMLGGFEAGGEYLDDGKVDPTKVAIAAASGAVFPSANRVGEKLMGAGGRLVPGRPGRTANPAADQAHSDVDDIQAEQAVGDSSLAQPPPGPDGVTTGNPQSAPQRSERVYPKDQTAEQVQGDILTQGDMDPATSAALAEANPEQAPAPVQPAPAAQEQAPAPSPVVPPAAAQVNAQKPRISLKKMPTEPVVDAGFPKPDEPVATGANDATPLPEGTPERAAKAIAKSKLAAVNKKLGSLTEPPEKAPPAIKGETPINDSITDAQKEAGNYPKARTHDFGKPIAIETHAGDVRRGTSPDGTPWENVSPYEYGYFNKTVGPDKGANGKRDAIDFARPKDGSPELGDKHFIIDQKDAATGKYDEPKVFTYVKDEATARDLFNKGFSDGKGEDRLHDITEVSRPELVKYLAKHTSNPPKGPYGEPMPKVKPAAQRAVVQDLVTKLKAQGKDEEAAKVLATPDEQLAAATAGQRVRKYGVQTGASAGYPVEGLLNSEGKPVTANTKAKAAERSAAHKNVTDWYKKTAPAKADETPGELLDRIKGLPDLSGWSPTFKPKEWMLAREAKRVLAKPAPKMVEKFRDAERQLRGGDQDVENYRGGNRIEADISRSRRGGDDAIANAEAKQQLPGRNDTEDALIDAIDKKRAAKFDVPHEEAESMVKPTPVKTKADLKELPRKTIDVADSPLAIDTKAISKGALEGAAKRKAEAAALAGKKADPDVRSEDRRGNERKKTSIDINDPETIKRLVEMSNKAAKKSTMDEGTLAREDLTQQPSGRPAYNETARLFDKLREFGGNTDASLNIGKIKADLQKALQTTPTKSYVARPGHPGLEPHADYTRSMSDELHALDNKNTLHEEAILDDFLRNLPKEATANNGEMLTRIFKAREADSAHLPLPAGATSHIDALAPADKAVWDKHLKPKSDEVEDFHNTLAQIDPELAGPDVEHYIARITKGNTPEFDMLRKNDDPVIRRNSFSVNASMANERPFVALENVKTGERHVIQNRDDGFTLWANRKALRIKDPGYEFEANQPYSVKNNKTGATVDYIMRHATTDEIMKSGARFDLGKDKNGKTITAPARYHQNAALAIALAHTKLGTMARNVVELARLSSTPEFQKLATNRPTQAQLDAGWEQTKMPNFKGTYMDPQLREVFDDYAGTDKSWGWLRHLNQAVTKLLFWMPTAHIANVGAHWFVGRGFDNLNVKRGLTTSMKAMQSVLKQDHIQKEMMENGAGLIYPSVRTRQFIEKVAHAVGESMSADPKSGWRAAAEAAGVPFKAVHDFVYNNSSKVMWAANDMFLTQRYLELKQKGLSPKEAISKAERDIPNYRVPTRIGLGAGQKGRDLSTFLQDNNLLAFSRYHVGMMNAYSDITRSTFGAKATVGDRVEGLGKLLALGALAAAYPMADKLAQYVTGNEAATQNRRGPMAIPSHLSQALQGKEDIASAARTTVTLQPLISTLMETLFNKDFRGKPVVEPGDVRTAAQGHLPSVARVATQAGEHLARGLISPISTLENAAKKAEPGTSQATVPLKAVRDQAFDVKNPSAKARKYERMIPIKTARDANARFKQGGSGVLEGLVNKVVGK